MFFRLCLAYLGGLFLLAGCTVGPNYRRPPVPQSASFKEEKGPWKTAEPRDEISKGDWYAIFQDPQLNALEEKAQAANQNLEAAIARVDETRASARETLGQFFPTITLDPTITRDRISPNNGQQRSVAVLSPKPHTYNTINVPLDLSYEIDLWGHIRRLFESARNLAEATVADYENVLLTLKSDVATNYFALRTADAQIKVQLRAIGDRQSELDLTQARFKGGISTDLDVQQALAELASDQAQLSSLRQNRAVLEHAIAVLIGEPPSELSVPESPLDGEAPPIIPAGLPSDLLERRPDVAGAERRMAAQNAQIGVAISAYFPVVRLTGTLGVDSGNISTVFNWSSHIWSLGPNISLPIFEGGQISANVRLQRATYEENVATYRQQVLVSFQDVEDSLSNLRYLAQQEEAQTRATQAYLKTLQLTQDRYKAGLVSYFDVTTAERNELTSEQTQVQVHGNEMSTTVLLIKALGGGWAEPATRVVAPKKDEITLPQAEAVTAVFTQKSPWHSPS